MQLFGLGEISDAEITLIEPESAKNRMNISTFVEKCAIIIRLQVDCDCSPDCEPTTGLRYISDIVIVLSCQVVDLRIHLIIIIGPLQTEVELSETAVVLTSSCLCMIKPTSPVLIDKLPLITQVAYEKMSYGRNELMTQVDQLAGIVGSLFFVPPFLVVVTIPHRDMLQPRIEMCFSKIEGQQSFCSEVIDV